MKEISVSPGDRSAARMYALLDRQVKSYHKQRHMGENSSVPMELARELMESVAYTLDRAEMYSGDSLEAALLAGQTVLAGQVERANALLELVLATAPQWQTECRWEALDCLGRYLKGYDHLHLAHRGPEDLFYPIIMPEPDSLRGIDQCLFYLNCLWLENQIMAGFEDSMLDTFWDLLPRDTLNQCEALLFNGLGKAALGFSGNQLGFSCEEYGELQRILRGRTREEMQSILEASARWLCEQLSLEDANARCLVGAAVPQLMARLGASPMEEALRGIFLPQV